MTAGGGAPVPTPDSLPAARFSRASLHTPGQHVGWDGPGWTCVVSRCCGRWVRAVRSAMSRQIGRPERVQTDHLECRPSFVTVTFRWRCRWERISFSREPVPTSARELLNGADNTHYQRSTGLTRRGQRLGVSAWPFATRGPTPLGNDIELEADPGRHPRRGEEDLRGCRRRLTRPEGAIGVMAARLAFAPSARLPRGD